MRRKKNGYKVAFFNYKMVIPIMSKYILCMCMRWHEVTEICHAPFRGMTKRRSIHKALRYRSTLVFDYDFFFETISFTFVYLGAWSSPQLPPPSSVVFSVLEFDHWVQNRMSSKRTSPIDLRCSYDIERVSHILGANMVYTFVGMGIIVYVRFHFILACYTFRISYVLTGIWPLR